MVPAGCREMLSWFQMARHRIDSPAEAMSATMAVHHLFLNQRDGGHTASEAEKADLKKAEKQIQKIHLSGSPFFLESVKKVRRIP